MRHQPQHGPALPLPRSRARRAPSKRAYRARGCPDAEPYARARLGSLDASSGGRQASSLGHPQDADLPDQVFHVAAQQHHARAAPVHIELVSGTAAIVDP